MRLIALTALAAVASIGIAEAQKGGPAPAQSRFPPKEVMVQGPPPDLRAEPRYGEITLQVGFEPDPREVAVDAGGSREATQLGPNCAGWIDFSRPDYNLTYTPGTQQYPLYIAATSQADTTIVINDPQGNWHCNDDLEGLNPGVVFQRPLHGLYNIWVGTLERGPTQPATIRISEVPPRR
jgi:serine protease Do